jgi:hypothetical protein
MLMNVSAERRYRRAPQPIHFPEREEVPESKWHAELRVILYEILKLAFADRASIGCDQFVYWDPTNPKECLAPDDFVRVGPKDELFGSWKVWERGAPHVAVEIVSEYDERGQVWEHNLAKYRRLGVVEVVRVDCESATEPLRVWDAVGGDLVERELADSRRAECGPLGLEWVVVEDARLGLMLRVADPVTRRLLPTPAEAAEETAKAAEAERDRAVERVRQLELELTRLKSST